MSNWTRNFSHFFNMKNIYRGCQQSGCGRGKRERSTCPMGHGGKGQIGAGTLTSPSEQPPGRITDARKKIRRWITRNALMIIFNVPKRWRTRPRKELKPSWWNWNNYSTSSPHYTEISLKYLWLSDVRQVQIGIFYFDKTRIIVSNIERAVLPNGCHIGEGL